MVPPGSGKLGYAELSFIVETARCHVACRKVEDRRSPGPSSSSVRNETSRDFRRGSESSFPLTDCYEEQFAIGMNVK
jgi:hypothetical protein